MDNLSAKRFYDKTPFYNGVFFLLLQVAACGAGAAAENKAIFGADDRQDVYQVGDRMFLEKQRSVAAMISVDRINGTQLSGANLSQRVCAGQKFADQVMISKCTGFLVREDLIVTAAHCVVTAEDCDNFKWVFGFQAERANQNKYTVAAEDIYSCVQVVERAYGGFGNVDHAVVQLDRPVRNRPPLAFRTEGRIDGSAGLALIGHPSGLPAKIVLAGGVLDNSNPDFFASDLDTFDGNSGSPVFDRKTGVVEGIVVRGHADYIRPPGQTCKVPKVCTVGACNTSDAGRITNVKLLHPAAIAGS
ncbi:MAG: serine protease [Elusimicrobiales bacterium]|jgi:hypothetical protein